MLASSAQFTKDIMDQLDLCARSYYSFPEIHTTFFTKDQGFEHVKCHNIDIYFNHMILRYSYYPHLNVTHSVLTCYVSVEKSETKRVFYPLCEFFGLFGRTPENALTIPLILSPESASECFDMLTAEFQKIQVQLESFSYDLEGKENFFESQTAWSIQILKKELTDYETMEKAINQAGLDYYQEWIESQSTTYGQEESKERFERMMRNYLDETKEQLEKERINLLQNHYQLMLNYWVSPTYEDYMTGNYHQALIKLRKNKYPSPYDQLLIAYMENAEEPNRHVPDSVYHILTKILSKNIPKHSLKEALAIGPAMILFGLMWIPLFLLLYLLFFYLENRNTLYLLGPLSNMPSVMFPSMIMGIVTIYFRIEWFYGLFFRKKYDQYMKLEYATNTPGTRRFMKWMRGAILFCSVIFIGLTVHHNVKLTDQGLVDNSGFWKIQGTFYAYDEIAKVYYREETPDGYGGMMEYPSYVIELNNGKILDFYDFSTDNAGFLQVFREKDIPVVSP